MNNDLSSASELVPRRSLLRPYTLDTQTALHLVGSSTDGLSSADALDRRVRFGWNVLPRAKSPTVAVIFLHQFKSPLIYVLLAAATISLLSRDWTDAAFISTVLLINAAIGTFQEHAAERSASALQNLLSPRARVQRDGLPRELDAAELVPGDIVFLESGAKVPADLRLLDAQNLSVDESLLTGESLPVAKNATAILAAETPLGDRINMAFAGTLATTGRAHGVVAATRLDTELGRIAAAILDKPPPKPPLIVRMEIFTRRIAIAIGIAAAMVAFVSLARGEGVTDVLMLAVALAVSAIPEGLPVALTVALAVGMNRMARRNVIVRRLTAMEGLGSCTCIVSDKTGTLTVNRLTAERLQFVDCGMWEITGEGLAPGGTFRPPTDAVPGHDALVLRLCHAAALANEGRLSQRDDEWVGQGDTVDVALLVMAHKAGLQPTALEDLAPQIAVIPYESELRFAASFNRFPGGTRASVKGAPETVMSMCNRAATAAGESSLDANEIRRKERALAAAGYRVLALADGALALAAGESFSREHLRDLVFLGLVGLSDPLRPEAKEAVAACRRAGILVAMVTGDHPVTAFAIGRELGLAREAGEVVNGAQLAAAVAAGERALDKLCAGAQVFARIEPQQKLQIVQSLQRSGHFVAVTGDGVNDAPALRAAQVGVAMGRGGTDVARETAQLVLTDDNFASIVAGIEEGRVAYANIRKVIFLLISTGAAEIVLFGLALAMNLPLPLVAAQLLWLNLVTNGIQDVALAFEPAEGGELARPPRPPREPIFNRVMIERVLLSAAVIGGIGFAAYHAMLAEGVPVGDARNAMLLLMVLFENVQALNSRSENLSVFRRGFLRNGLLVFGTMAAQLVHIGAMYTPGLSDVLGLRPVSLKLWSELLALALLLLAVMELHKLYRRRRSERTDHLGKAIPGYDQGSSRAGHDT